MNPFSVLREHRVATAAKHPAGLGVLQSKVGEIAGQALEYVAEGLAALDGALESVAPLVRKPPLHVLEGGDLLVVEGAAGLLGEVEIAPAFDGGPELVGGRGPEHRRGPAEPRRRRLQAGADDLVGLGFGALSVSAPSGSVPGTFFSRRPPVA